jgi:hypothetical protein
MRKAARGRAAVGAAICRGGAESQAKPGASAKVKSYLDNAVTLPQRLERPAALPVGPKTNRGECAMYIGLGGLLILILVLWLLGVI